MNDTRKDETLAVRLKRVAPGSYVTVDGLYEVHGFQRPEKCAYGPAGEWVWYWRPAAGVAEDRYSSKREAVAALAFSLKQEAK